MDSGKTFRRRRGEGEGIVLKNVAEDGSLPGCRQSGKQTQFGKLARCVCFFNLFWFFTRVRGTKKADAMVVGGGDEAHYVIRLLNNGLIYRPVCVVDKENTGRMVDGLPVYHTINAALDSHKADCVFIASTTLSNEEKEEIHQICEKQNITVRDYTNFFTYTEAEICEKFM